MTTTRCGLTDLLTDQCAHCQQKARKALRPRLTRREWMLYEFGPETVDGVLTGRHETYLTPELRGDDHA